MVTRVFVEIPVEAEQWDAFERFVSDPRQWLPAPAIEIGTGKWIATLHAGPVGQSAVVKLAPPWRLPDARSRHVRWEPEPGMGLARSHLLPSFIGQLTLRYSTASGLWLTLNGHYVPPAGRAGEVADRVALHKVGESTALRFLRDVGARLEEPVAETAAALTG